MADRSLSFDERRRHQKAGQWSELAAALYLRAKGYRILARRFKTKSGEIDIIAKRGRCLVFVEVKRRATRAGAEASITGAQEFRIKQAAGDWLARHPAHRELDQRFDLIFIVRGRFPRHIENGLT
jgi:putative endonuclease